MPFTRFQELLAQDPSSIVLLEVALKSGGLSVGEGVLMNVLALAAPDITLLLGSLRAHRGVGRGDLGVDLLLLVKAFLLSAHIFTLSPAQSRRHQAGDGSSVRRMASVIVVEDDLANAVMVTAMV